MSACPMIKGECIACGMSESGKPYCTLLERLVEHIDQCPEEYGERTFTLADRREDDEHKVD